VRKAEAAEGERVYLGCASWVVDGAGDEDAAAAVDDEGAVVVGDGGIGRGCGEGERHEGGEQQATAAGDEKGRRNGLPWGHTPLQCKKSHSLCVACLLACALLLQSLGG
jgi:hypothetical protein